MTFDLGYGPGVFYDDVKINKMIQEVEETFDLILIVERLDESLILLGHALCWSLDDLIALRKNARTYEYSLTPEGEGWALFSISLSLSPSLTDYVRVDNYRTSNKYHNLSAPSRFSAEKKVF